MPTTVKDIAAKLGISPSTVSRALTGSTEVSAKTRARVLQAAQELHYTPNLLARSLVRASNNIIGCLILEFANPFFVPVIQAIEDVAEERGYVAMISESRRSLELEQRVVQRFQMVRVGGMIITPVLEEIAHLLQMRAEGTPIIAVGRSCEELDCITIDNRLGGAMVGHHFIEKGHRHIGVVISGEPFNEPERSRQQGLYDALAEAGLPRRADWAFSVGNNNPTGGARAAEMWLALSQRPTAMFCTTDRLAMGFIHRIQEAGLRVPDDVAVAGFDDIPFSDYLEVPLTTVAYPKYEMGELATRRLIDLIENPDPHRSPEQVLLEPRLIPRRSSGA